MKKAFVFPGQGSQSVGMGREVYNNYAVAKDAFMEVDDALGEKLSELIFNGPIEELTLTANAQPAIMVTSIAILRAKQQDEKLNIEQLCDYVAGHSLGEYTALCAAGAISLSDTAKLLRLRGKSMQNAVAPGVGAMAAVLGMSIENLKEILASISKDDFVVEIANDNCPGQLVISGHTKAVELAAEKIIAAGNKLVKLPVSAPFHCSLMNPVKEIMNEALHNTKIIAPKIPLISNVFVTEVTDPKQIIEGLVAQVSGMVRWRESMLYLKQLGVLNLVEIGAGKVLTGMNKRIDSEFILS